MPILNAQDFINKLRLGQYDVVSDFTDYLHTKYSPFISEIGSDDLSNLTIYELSQTDITKNDLFIINNLYAQASSFNDEKLDPLCRSLSDLLTRASNTVVIKDQRPLTLPEAAKDKDTAEKIQTFILDAMKKNDEDPTFCEKREVIFKELENARDEEIPPTMEMLTLFMSELILRSLISQSEDLYGLKPISAYEIAVKLHANAPELLNERIKHFATCYKDNNITLDQLKRLSFNIADILLKAPLGKKPNVLDGIPEALHELLLPQEIKAQLNECQSTLIITSKLHFIKTILDLIRKPLESMTSSDLMDLLSYLRCMYDKIDSTLLTNAKWAAEDTLRFHLLQETIAKQTSPSIYDDFKTTLEWFETITPRTERTEPAEKDKSLCNQIVYDLMLIDHFNAAKNGNVFSYARLHDDIKNHIKALYGEPPLSPDDLSLIFQYEWARLNFGYGSEEKIIHFLKTNPTYDQTSINAMKYTLLQIPGAIQLREFRDHLPPLTTRNMIDEVLKGSAKIEATTVETNQKTLDERLTFSPDFTAQIKEKYDKHLTARTSPPKHSLKALSGVIAALKSIENDSMLDEFTQLMADYVYSSEDKSTALATFKVESLKRLNKLNNVDSLLTEVYRLDGDIFFEDLHADNLEKCLQYRALIEKKYQQFSEEFSPEEFLMHEFLLSEFSLADIQNISDLMTYYFDNHQIFDEHEVQFLVDIEYAMKAILALRSSGRIPKHRTDLLDTLTTLKDCANDDITKSIVRDINHRLKDNPKKIRADNRLLKKFLFTERKKRFYELMYPLSVARIHKLKQDALDENNIEERTTLLEHEVLLTRYFNNLQQFSYTAPETFRNSIKAQMSTLKTILSKYSSSNADKIANAVKETTGFNYEEFITKIRQEQQVMFYITNHRLNKENLSLCHQVWEKLASRASMATPTSETLKDVVKDVSSDGGNTNLKTLLGVILLKEPLSQYLAILLKKQKKFPNSRNLKKRIELINDMLRTLNDTNQTIEDKHKYFKDKQNIFRHFPYQRNKVMEETSYIVTEIKDETEFNDYAPKQKRGAIIKYNNNYYVYGSDGIHPRSKTILKDKDCIDACKKLTFTGRPQTLPEAILEEIRKTEAHNPLPNYAPDYDEMTVMERIIRAFSLLFFKTHVTYHSESARQFSFFHSEFNKRLNDNDNLDEYTPSANPRD